MTGGTDTASLTHYPNKGFLHSCAIGCGVPRLAACGRNYAGENGVQIEFPIQPYCMVGYDVLHCHYTQQCPRVPRCVYRRVIYTRQCVAVPRMGLDTHPGWFRDKNIPHVNILDFCEANALI